MIPEPEPKLYIHIYTHYVYYRAVHSVAYIVLVLIFISVCIWYHIISTHHLYNTSLLFLPSFLLPFLATPAACRPHAYVICTTSLKMIKFSHNPVCSSYILHPHPHPHLHLQKRPIPDPNQAQNQIQNPEQLLACHPALTPYHAMPRHAMPCLTPIETNRARNQRRAESRRPLSGFLCTHYPLPTTESKYTPTLIRFIYNRCPGCCVVGTPSSCVYVEIRGVYLTCARVNTHFGSSLTCWSVKARVGSCFHRLGCPPYVGPSFIRC